MKGKWRMPLMILVAAIMILAGIQSAIAAEEPIKIGLLTSRSGVFSEWGTQEIRGLQLGFDYATKGTNKVLGREIKLIIEDDAASPQIGVQKAIKLLAEDKVDILSGAISSAVALAVMEKAKEYKKPYVISCAASNAITGANFNRYTFRIGRSLRQVSLAGSKYIVSKVGKKVAFFGADYAGGRDFIAAWKTDLAANGAEIVLELYAPLTTTDFTPYLQKIKASEAKALILSVTGANFEVKLPQQIVELGIDKKMKVALDFSDGYLRAVGLPGVGMVGTIMYYHTLFDNAMNKWFVEHHQQRFGTPPELWAGNSFAAGIALVAAIEKAKSVNTEALIKTLEGLEFYGPKSLKEKMRIRPEDHQAMQGVPVVELIKTDKAYPEPKLLFLPTAADCTPPILAPKP
jgi:branched-chain amino acid transport system substrate-binding protein